MNSLIFTAILSLVTTYMNDKSITLSKEFTESSFVRLYYNAMNKNNGSVGGNIRMYGMHNMSVEVEGYKPVDLIKDDVCLYPHMFTMLGCVLPKNNVLVQRWACVKWNMPLTFNFEVVNDVLKIRSSVYGYRLVTLWRTSVDIPLVPVDLISSEKNEKASEKKDPFIKVTVNNGSVVTTNNRMVQVQKLMNSMPEIEWFARALFL